MRGSCLSSFSGGQICFLSAVVFFCFAANTFAQDRGPAADPAVPVTSKAADIPAKAADTPPKAAGPVKVDFETGTDGVVIVESNGEKLRIDTIHKTVEKLAETAIATAPPVQP